MLAVTIPQDYARRWYVADAVAEHMERFAARHPKASAAEIEREELNALREAFRSDTGYRGPLAVHS